MVLLTVNGVRESFMFRIQCQSRSSLSSDKGMSLQQKVSLLLRHPLGCRRKKHIRLPRSAIEACDSL
jgi:hypothetical protein